MNLSPFLFSIFINDLDSFLSSCNIRGLESITSDIDEQFDIYIRLFSLLYADDTVLMAENENDMQNLLDSFSDYCTNWKLKVNIEKTKIMIFSRGVISNIFPSEHAPTLMVG